MKEIDDEKWLKNMFSEQPERELSPGFEASLISKIKLLETERQEKEQLRQQKRVFWSATISSVVAAAAIVFAFSYFGWYKPLAASANEIAHQFGMMKLDLVVLIPILSIFMLLVGDLLARRYLEKW
jgi:hypothetical protein